MNGNIILRPWAGPRAQGRKAFAMLLFFMQLSLVFWPAAVRAAQRLEMARQKQALLDHLAARHAPIPADARARASQVGFEGIQGVPG